MNKKELALTTIGDDPASWNKTAPLPPIPEWFEQEFDRLKEVVSHIVAGESEKATHSLSLARDRDEEMRKWYSIAIWVGTARACKLNRTSGQESVSRDKQDRKLGAPDKRALFRRDGYRCQYCGGRIIPEEVLIAISNTLGEEAFRVRGTDTTRRGAAMIFRAVEDHVEPLSRGGKTSDDNLVTSCYPCNFSKSGFTLEQIGLDDPRDRTPTVDDWDGLVSLLPALKTRTGELRR